MQKNKFLVNSIIVSVFFLLTLAVCFCLPFMTKQNFVLAEGETTTIYITYKVTLNGNTREMTSEEINGNPTSYLVTNDTPPLATIKAPVSKKGYVFNGWWLDGNINELEYDSETTSYIIPRNSITTTENITLYADFSAISYKINYKNLPQGVSLPTKNTYTIEESVDLNSLVPIMFSYAFVGWYSDASLTNEIHTIEVGSTGDIDIYGKYVEKVCKVSFADDIFEQKTVKFGDYAYGDNGILQNLIPTRDGYTFDGWFTNKNLEPSSYVRSNYQFSDEEITLYAKWAKKADPIWAILGGIFAGITVICFVCWIIFARPKIKD